MNDQPLPMSTFPCVWSCLVVWNILVKLSTTSPCSLGPQATSDGKAYRIPSSDGTESPQHLGHGHRSINRFNVRSIFVRPPDEIWHPGVPNEIQGVAFDSATELPSGVSTARYHWADARLDAELGKYSWRRWRAIGPRKTGLYRLMARAAIRSERLRARRVERSGSCGNVIERVDVRSGVSNPWRGQKNSFCRWDLRRSSSDVDRLNNIWEAAGMAPGGLCTNPKFTTSEPCSYHRPPMTNPCFRSPGGGVRCSLRRLPFPRYITMQPPFTRSACLVKSPDERRLGSHFRSTGTADS